MKECDLDFDLQKPPRPKSMYLKKTPSISKIVPSIKKVKMGAHSFKMRILVLKSRPWAKKLSEKILVLKVTLD